MPDPTRALRESLERLRRTQEAVREIAAQVQEERLGAQAAQVAGFLFGYQKQKGEETTAGPGT